MSLVNFDKNEKMHAEGEITRIVGCKVWYVYDGRNAWHSTWVHKYRSGCFHLNVDSAKQFCEKNRKQGSIFYIEQIPALEIDCDHGSLFITQINTTDPLHGYSIHASDMQPHIASGFLKDEIKKDLSIGAYLIQAATSFDRSSRFWIDPPPVKNSLVELWLDNSLKVNIAKSGEIFVIKNENPDLLDSEPLKGFTSKSVGKNRPLTWDPRLSRARQNGVVDILLSVGALAKVIDIRTR